MHVENNDLDQATTVLRELSVPQGPSVETLQATLAALALHSSRRAGRFRRVLHSYRLAAGIAVVIGVGALITILFPHGAAEPVALGAVLEHIRTARTLRYVVTYSAEPSSAPERIYLKGSRRRSERTGMTEVSDAATRQKLILLPAHKVAIVSQEPILATSESPGQPQQPTKLLEKLEALQDQPGSYRGFQELNARPVLVFESEQYGAQWKILADPQTQLPLQVTIFVPLFQTTITLSDFVFDSEIPDELFSLVPPPGYAVKQQNGNQPIMMDTPEPAEGEAAGTSTAVGVYTVTVPSGAEGADFSAPTEQDLTAYLQLLAERNSGAFPSRERFLQPEDLQARLMAAPADQRDQITRSWASLFLKQERAHAYLRRSGATDPEYLGESVTLGDSARPILLWVVGEQPKVRVIFGDLSVREYAIESPEWQAVCKTLPGSHVHEPLRLGPAAAPTPALPEE